MSKHLIILAAILFVPVLVAQVSEDGFVLFTPDELEWTLRENGTSLVLLEGDPQSEGFYIQRLKFPPGSVTTPHYHDRDRYVTVISGTWYAGIGEDVDRENAAALGPGSYMKHPAGGVHYDGAKDEEVVVEIKGMGPVRTIFLEN